ncbi:hypothetical protein LXL04_004269 [Taraxacum kok-saghyz]
MAIATHGMRSFRCSHTGVMMVLRSWPVQTSRGMGGDTAPFVPIPKRRRVVLVHRIVGVVKVEIRMGYPCDAPATVLFGEWFRFGKPSDQKFLFEKTGDIKLMKRIWGQFGLCDSIGTNKRLRGNYLFRGQFGLDYTCKVACQQMGLTFKWLFTEEDLTDLEVTKMPLDLKMQDPKRKKQLPQNRNSISQQGHPMMEERPDRAGEGMVSLQPRVNYGRVYLRTKRFLKT